MNILTPLLTPLDIWASIGSGLNAIMQPIYWAISGILVGFHSLWSMALDANSGWTWVLSIVSLTIVVRSALIPLFVRQINSSRKMQLLSPKLQDLQTKYAHDKERLGQETMKLYKDEGVNPMASCLPLFLQMPIFIGLFNVLNFVSMGVPMGEFFEKSPHLVDSLRNATIFGAKISGRFGDGLNEGVGSTQFVAAFLIVGMVASLFFTQLHMMRKNMPPESLKGPMAQQQKMMLYMFPAIYLITGVSVPIGVMIYWLASNLWTLGQQYILIINSPSPNTPAYIDWEERMRAKGKDPEAVLRKRLGMDKKKGTATPSDPTKVARQGRSTSKPTTSKPAVQKPDESTPSADNAGKQQVKRQQPTRQSKAKRKRS